MNRPLKTFACLLLAGIGVAGQSPSQMEVKFVAYDRGNGGQMSFQINRVDVRVPSSFLLQGGKVSGTDYRIGKFAFKENFAPATGKKTDVSELELVHTETKRRVTLVIGTTVKVPEK